MVGGVDFLNVASYLLTQDISILSRQVQWLKLTALSTRKPANLHNISYNHTIYKFPMQLGCLTIFLAQDTRGDCKTTGGVCAETGRHEEK